MDEATGRAGISEVDYRPVRTVLAYRVPDEPETDPGFLEEDTPVERIACLVRVPNAMRPAGWRRAGPKAKLALFEALANAPAVPGRWSLFDRDGAFLEVLDDAEFQAQWHPSPQDPCVHYAFTGPGLAREGDPRGIASQAVDYREAWSGLARLDADGFFLVEADAPLAIQGAVLAGISSEVGEDAACADHLVQVALAAQRVVGAGDVDPGAWIDVQALSDVVDAARSADGEPLPSAMDVAGASLDELDAADRAAPMWAVGPRWELPTGAWLSRDTPGAGALWTMIDRSLTGWTGGNRPNANAQCVLFEGEVPLPESVRAYLDAGELIAMNKGDRVVRHPGGANAAFLSQGGLGVAVAWIPGGGGPARHDPLMTEGLLDVGLDIDAHAEAPSPSVAEAMVLFAGMDLVNVLPRPDIFPGYPAMALAKAHRDGEGLADLCASLGALLRDGVADDAFAPEGGGELDAAGRAGVERTASMAEGAGGRRSGTLDAMLRGVDPDLWYETDLARDVALLLDAVRLGATLAHLASTTFQFDDADAP